jgi:hypothetical protein
MHMAGSCFAKTFFINFVWVMAALNPKRFQNLAMFSGRDRLQWRRKLLVFSFFLLLSIIIWLLNALSKDYTSEIEYPITYTDIPGKKMLIGDMPEDLRLKVNARGYSLLIYNLSNRPVPINFRVSAFTMNSFPGDSTRYFLLTRFAREQIARQLPAELQLVDFSPDTLFFQFANKVSKKVAVRSAVQFQPVREFTLVDRIRIEPDSVLVTGPDIYVDTLQAIRTEQRNLGILEKSYEGSLVLKAPEDIVVNTQKVLCTIALEKITEFQVSVPIQVNNLPDSLRLQTFPQNIKITGKVGLSKYDRIVPEVFWAAVDYSDVLANKTQLTVQVQKRPDFLITLDYYPQSVEYLITVE